MRSEAQLPTSAAQQFKATVTSVSGPGQGWRDGLERSRAKSRLRRTISRAAARCKNQEMSKKSCSAGRSYG
jgi:hypothetical protein